MKVSIHSGLLVSTAILSLATIATAAAYAETNDDAVQIETVKVTATKTSEREIDVPIPVTAISSASLAATNSLHIEDYAASIPSLSIATQGNGRALAVIRGISTGTGNNPTVGFTIDDVPIGSSTSGGIGDAILPEIDPSVLQSVEVLRGPQGSLYGAASMGGLIRYVTTTPDASRLYGEISASTAAVAHGSVGYGVRGALNTPVVADKMALQVSAYYREDPGYTDNIRNDDKDYNVSRSSGGRIALMWQITPKVSYELSTLIQTRKTDGSTRVDVSFDRVPLNGSIYENDRVPGTNIGRLNFNLYSGTLKADLDFADFTAVTAYSRSAFNGPQDASTSFDKYLSYFYDEDVVDSLDSVISDYQATGKFSQEVRLSSKPGSDLEWMVGGFFTRETSEIYQTVYAADAETGAAYDAQYLYTVYDPSSYNEYALFGSATYHFSKAFDLQIGGRISAQHQTYVDELNGLMEDSTLDRTAGDSSANVFTWSITPRYHINDDMMVYARVATGYRPGGVNTAPDASGSYGPDRTVNYELGFKGVILEDLMTVDASIFNIEWSHVQLEAASPTNFSYIENGGRARSRGLEFSTLVTPGDGWTITANFSLVDATLTQDIDVSSLYGLKGQRLPFSSKTSGSLGVDKSFPLDTDLSASLGVKFNYSGSRYAAFPTSSSYTRFFMPAYGTMDLHASLDYQDWELSVYANNVFDQVGFTYGQSRNVATRAGNYDAAIISPRTVGLSVTRKF